MKPASYNVCFETLANKLRVDIIEALREKELSVSEIAKEVGAEQSRVSHALERLKKCGFVEFKQDGKKRVYSLEKKLGKELKEAKKRSDVLRAIVLQLGNCPVYRGT